MSCLEFAFTHILCLSKPDYFTKQHIFSKADEQDRLKNLDEDISDGGSDTDTLQRKLAVLTSTSLPGVMSSRCHDNCLLSSYTPIPLSNMVSLSPKKIRNKLYIIVSKLL